MTMRSRSNDLAEDRVIGFAKQNWKLLTIGVGLLVFLCGAYGCNVYSSAVHHENGIEAENANMENVVGAGYTKIAAQGGAVDKYKEIFISALEIAMEGRYGKTGSQAAFQWIQESHPELPANIIRALQEAIEATFNRLEAVQTAKIDKIRVYKDFLGEPLSGFVARRLGFPKLDIKAMSEVVSSTEAKEAMETKELTKPKM